MKKLGTSGIAESTKALGRYRYGGQGNRIIQLRSGDIGADVIEHELGHAFQQNTGKFGGPRNQSKPGFIDRLMGRSGNNWTQSEQELMDQFGTDIKKFLSDPEGYDSLLKSIKGDTTTMYSAKSILDKPVELFASLVQASRNGAAFKNNPQAVEILKKLMKFHGFAKGGMVYANNGALIPYRSMGTDTVPAMLTPGEFVVNRQSTSQHLPLLRAINSGYNKHSMMTNYLAKGGVAGSPQYLQQGGITRGAANNGVSVGSKIEGLEEFKAVVAQLNEAMSGGTENMNNVVNQISQASVAFSATAQSVQAAAINIPESVNVAQNVRVDGIPDTLNDFSNNLLNSSVAQSTQQTSKQFSDLNTKNEGSLGLPSPNNNQFIT